MNDCDAYRETYERFTKLIDAVDNEKIKNRVGTYNYVYSPVKRKTYLMVQCIQLSRYTKDDDDDTRFHL